MGVVFFLSLPSMGVMLFPSFVLGNAFGEGGTLFVPLFLFSHFLPLSLLFSPSPSFSHSLFLIFLFFPISLSFPFAHSLSFFPSLSSPSPSFLVSLPLFPSPFSSSLFLFLSLSWGFFFEGTACTVCFRDVRNDATDCNQLFLYCNKEKFYFLNLEFCTF